MSWFPCFPLISVRNYSTDDYCRSGNNGNISARSFTFRELASATMDFRKECLVGEGGFGRVYKGYLENTNQIVAVKLLDRNGLQGNNEFIVEVLMLSLLQNSNLVNLIGYCSDGDQRLLVYEFMQLGSLEDQLFELTPDQTSLSWDARMRIAIGTAKGLEYLHEEANPPVIHGDLKSSNILLDEEFNPKLSDFGLAKLDSAPENDSSSRVMGSYGYCAPDFARTGQITIKSDVYSYGVLLLELITGRRAFDSYLPPDRQNIVPWAKPMLKDPRRFHELVDPLLQGNYDATKLNQVIAISAMCLHEEPMARPFMTDVVKVLGFLSSEQPPHFQSQSQSQSETHRNEISSATLPPQRSINIREEHTRLCMVLEEDNSLERSRAAAVAEAIKWGEDSRNKTSRRIRVLH